VVPQRGKPDRRVFRITQKGREALGAWLHSHQPLTPVRDPLLVRLALADGMPDQEIAALLVQARDDYQARLDTLRSDVAAPIPACAATDERGSELYRMTLGAAIAATRSVIDWIDDCTDRIAQGLPAAAPRPTSEGS
jgi:PadR family transcriptional regulator AphA